MDNSGSATSDSPEHTVDTVQTQNNILDVSKKSCPDEYVSDAVREHTGSESENVSHDNVPDCTLTANIEQEAEELSLTNKVNCDESLSVHADEIEEREAHSKQGDGELQIESPVPEDRNLEQFSEVLLDSDSSASNHEVTTEEIDNKKDEKRVRFADEICTDESTEGTVQNYFIHTLNYYY